MNGASAEPCAKNKKAPNKIKISTNGHSQYLFRILRNDRNSPKISISYLLKLFVELGLLN